MEKDLKKFERLLETSETILLATDCGIGVYGSSADIMACFAILVKELTNCKGVTKETIQSSVDLAFKDEVELLKELSKQVNELLENIEKLKDTK